MFIYNVKLNGKQFVKVLFIIIAIIVTIYFGVSAYKIYNNSFKVKDELDESNIMYLTTDNYTNILKAVYENLDDYIGKNICFTGYVYRVIDFEETQFVLARDMITDSSDTQTLVVGFLCNYKNAQDFEDNCWVEITGEIAKGYYHGDMPIIDVEEITQIDEPQDNIYVYPPDDTYIPTSVIF